MTVERDTSRDARAEKIVIGLTGSIAAGKSTVAAILAERGALVIDADDVYRTLLQPGSKLTRRVAETFGPRVMAGNAIDRAALADIVFSDPAALATLEGIAHPAVEAQITAQLEEAREPVIVIEAVKLVQSGLVDLTDSLWVVTADADVRQRRLRESRGLSAAAAKSRMAASDAVVPAWVRPDVVIDNSGGMEATRTRVQTALCHLLRDGTESEGSRP